MDKKVVEKINASGLKFYFALTGGGTGFISDFISFGGASKSLIGANIPYNQRAFDKFIHGQKIEKYASEEGARKLAVAAFNECLEAGVNKKEALGVGASCSIASTSPEREGRKHKIHVAFHDMGSTYSINLVLNQGRTRAEEEEIINNFIYWTLAFRTTGNSYNSEYVKFESTLKDGESLTFNFGSASLDIGNLLKNKKEIIFNSKSIEDKKIVVYSGSWNPMHIGHESIIELSEQILNSPVFLEFSVDNAEKGSLDFIEVERRLEQIKDYPHIVSSAPHFRDKVEVLKEKFPNKEIIFVVGYDTWKRIWDEKYCLENSLLAESMFFLNNKVNFLVFGRGEPFKSLGWGEDFRIKDPRAEKFTMNISSTEIRNKQ